MSESLTTTSSHVALSMFATAELFELVQRQATLISKSDLIPKQFQNNVPNCAIALEMASRLGASPFAVIQNLDVIHGRPSWRAVFLMGLVNNCGRFTPIQFKVEVTGEPKTADLTIEGWENQKKISRPYKYNYVPTRCFAWARDKATGDVIEGPPVSYDMAIEEGWVSKAGSKWQTELRELMLRYRAASFFAKVYASDVMLGMQTSEEVYDSEPAMRNLTPEGPARTPDDTPPKVVTGASTPTPSSRGKAAKAAKDAVEAPTPPEGTEAKPADDDAIVVPPRPEMVDAIRNAFRAASFKTLPAAEGHCQEKGYLPRGKNFSALSDEELFIIYRDRETIFPSGFEQPAAETAPQGGDQ